MSVLLKTNEELKTFVAVSSGLSPDVITPFLENSEAVDEIIAVIGKGIYTELVTKYNDDTIGDQGNEKYKNLLPMVQKTLLNLAVYSWMQMGGAVLTSSGATLNSNRDNQAFQWQRVQIEDKLLRDGFYALESLIDYMVENKADFANWATSTEYGTLFGHLINSAKEFQKYVNIHSSRRLFKNILPILDHCEQEVIIPLITQELFNKLVAGIKARNLDADHKDLLEYCRRTLAFHTINQAVDEMSLSLTPDGAYLFHITASGASQIRKKEPADMDRLDKFQKRHHDKAVQWEDVTRKYLNMKADKFPEFKSSANYEDPETTSPTYNNLDKSKSTFNAL